MVDSSTKPSLLILLPKQKAKQFPPSILLPFSFPPTLKEKQQLAQAIKTPRLFIAPVPKGLWSSRLPTNLLPKNTHPSQVSHFYRAPQGAPDCFCPEFSPL